MYNMHQTVFLFAFPVKMWAILGFVGLMALTDPSKKDLGGMLTGLLVYQVLKIRMWNRRGRYLKWFLMILF